MVVRSWSKVGQKIRHMYSPGPRQGFHRQTPATLTPRALTTLFCSPNLSLFPVDPDIMAMSMRNRLHIVITQLSRHRR